MKVLVTGGGGFLGRYIVEQLLRRGDTVRIFNRKSYPDLASLGVECVQGDLRRLPDVVRACTGQDVVFHSASLPGISVWRRPFYETNVLGTKNILQACQISGVSKLIYTSSPSVTDPGTPQNDIDETTPYPTRYLAYYPETKAIAERLVLERNGSPWTVRDEQGAERSGHLLTCSLRPHLLWGPRDHHLIPRLLTRARSGLLTQVGNGTNLVDIIYIENAAHAHLLACDALSEGSPVAGSAYYLSQGKPINCWQWIGEILQLAGLPPVQRKISFQTAWRLGVFYENLYKLTLRKDEPPMTRFLATQLDQSHWFNISKANHDFGYRPIIDTEEGMRRLAQSLFWKDRTENKG